MEKFSIVWLQIETFEQEQTYTGVLQELLHEFRDVVTTLAEGFKDCLKYMPVTSSQILHG